MSDIRKCDYCETPLPTDSHKRRKYCQGKQCKSRAYEKRKGKKPPFKSIKTNQKYKLPQIVNQPSQQMVTGIHDQRELLFAQKNYWEGVLINAQKGIYSLVTLSGAGIGAAIGEALDSSKNEKAVLAIIGGIIGAKQDAKRKEQAIINAQYQLSIVNKRIRSLETVNKTVSSLRKSGKVNINNNEITIDNHPEILNSAQYRSVQIPSIKFDKKSVWHYLLGEPKENFHLLLSGAPGNGKTTFAVKFSDYFHRNHGEVIYMTSEQSGLDLNFQEMLNKYQTKFNIHSRPKGKSLQQISKDIAGHKIAVIDSINHIGYSVDDLEQLKKLNPKTAFITIMQNTKDGKFKGDNQYLHNADTHIEMINLVAHVKKSRSGSLTKAPVDDASI